MSGWDHLAGERYCYLTTEGRVTGSPHRIEIWFGIHDSSLYMLAGGGERADWVRNLRKNPPVTVEIGGETFAGQARIVDDEAEADRARELVHDKYVNDYSGDLSEWRQTALPVAVELPPNS